MRLTCLNGPIFEERKREKVAGDAFRGELYRHSSLSFFSKNFLLNHVLLPLEKTSDSSHNLRASRREQTTDEKHSSLVSHAPPPPNVAVSCCCWSEENFRVITIRGRYNVGWKWRGFPSCVFILLLFFFYLMFLFFSGRVLVHPIPSHQVASFS